VGGRRLVVGEYGVLERKAVLLVRQSGCAW